MGRILVIFLVLISFSTYGKAKDPVVATVNKAKIRKSIFVQTFRQNQLLLSHKKITKNKVIYDLINRVLGIDKAKKSKLHLDPTVRRKMEDVLYHAQISKDLGPVLNKIPKISDREIKQYYSNKKEYRTAHILFRITASPSPAQLKAAKDQALKVYAQVKKNPVKFPELANKFSQATTALNGGDMGFQPPPMLMPEYFKAINGKKAGHITRPVRTQLGYHIIIVRQIKDYAQINKEIYKKIIYDIKRDKIIENYFKKLRSKASIKINKKLL